MLQGPLAEVHHVRSLVDPHHAVGGAGGQHQTHVFRGKLNIRHRCPAVNQSGPLDLKSQETFESHRGTNGAKVQLSLEPLCPLKTPLC